MVIPFWILFAAGIIINILAVIYLIALIANLLDNRVSRIRIGWFPLIIWALTVFYWSYVLIG